MLVCGRCRGDGKRRWLLVLRRQCRTCGGRGVVAAEAPGFGSLAPPRPAPPVARPVDLPDSFLYGDVTGADACAHPGDGCGGDGGADGD
jgi:hypothetical protein